MSSAYAPAEAAYVFCDDRSVSAAGASLRASLEAAIEPPSDRRAESYWVIIRALDKAQRQDGISITPQTFQTFNRALDFLGNLPRQIPLPEVVIESESEIGLDWDESASRVLSLTIRDTPSIGFAGLFGSDPVHGRVAFAQEIPDTLRYFFRKLYPASRSRI